MKSLEQKQKRKKKIIKSDFTLSLSALLKIAGYLSVIIVLLILIWWEYT